MRNLSLLLVLAVLGSCANPLCGCTPEPYGAVIDATVRSAADERVAGLRLRAETARGSTCENFQSALQSGVTDSAGMASIRFIVFTSDSLCVRFLANDTASRDPDFLIPDTLRVRPKLVPWDTVAWTLVLPASVTITP